MLILFFSFREKSDFPIFDQRWNFFCSTMDDGKLYYDASRIMQNIQDVENSKKIGVIPDGIEQNTTALEKCTSQLNTFDDDQSDDSDFEQLNHDDVGNEFDYIMEEYEMHQDLFKDNLDEANCGTFLYKMKDSHILFQIQF